MKVVVSQLVHDHTHWYDGGRRHSWIHELKGSFISIVLLITTVLADSSLASLAQVMPVRLCNINDVSVIVSVPTVILVLPHVLGQPVLHAILTFLLEIFERMSRRPSFVAFATLKDAEWFSLSALFAKYPLADCSFERRLLNKLFDWHLICLENWFDICGICHMIWIG